MIDLDRLGAWLDEQGLGEVGEPIDCGFVSGGSQNEIYEIRRGDLHGALRIPPPTAPESRDEGIWREWRITEALEGTDVPHTPAIAACRDPEVLGRAFYVMGFVDGWSPMGLETQPDGSRPWPAPFADRPRGPGRARLPAGRGHRPARQRGLAGQGPGGPRSARWLPRAPGRPLDRVPRADQGPGAARLRRGRGLAAGPRADRLRPRPHARRLPVRQRHVRARRAGPAGRHRGLGDGHGR